MILTSVDLPAPLSPMSPTTSPGWSDNETSVSAWMAPKFLEIRWRSRIAKLLRRGGRALAEVGRRALVQAGVERIGDLLAADEVDQHPRRAVAHLERPLADLRMAASFLQRGELRRQRVAGDDDEVLGLELGHHLVGDLRVRLRAELRPA